MVTAPLRVLVIDDHAVIRHALSRALAEEPDIVLAAEAATAAEALATIGGAAADVVLVDLGLPDAEGSRMITGLRERSPASRLLVFTAYEDELRVAEAFRAGADGYLVKTASVAEVIDGIRRVASGEVVFGRGIARAVTRSLHRETSGSASGLDSLTRREREVARLLAGGVPVREIAARLWISRKTVETHRVRLYAKLGCSSAVELTRIAIRGGLVPA